MASSQQPPQPSPQQLVLEMLPHCDGNYGQCHRAAANFRADMAADEFNQQVRQVPPVEDVMRWKEFRRRQKVETQDNNLRQQQYQPPPSVHDEIIGENSRRSLGEKLSTAAAVDDDCEGGGAKDLSASTVRSIGGNSLSSSCGGDSHSLSFSESTMGTQHDIMKNHSLKASTTADTVSRTMASSLVTHSNSQEGGHSTKDTALTSARDMGGAVIEIIDPEGFPVFSPTSITSGISIDDDDEQLDENCRITTTAQSVSSTSQSRKGSSSSQANTEQYDDLVKEVDDFFSTLDCTLDAIAKRRTNNIVSSSLSGADNLTPSMSDEPVSEVTTAIISNTARYVADQSNKMARRMMLMMNENDSAIINDNNVQPSDTTKPKDGTDNGESEYYNVVVSSVCGEAPPFVRAAAAGKPTASVNAATPGIVPTKGMPRLLTPPTTSLNTASHRRELAATPSFTPFSSVQKHTPATPNVEPSPGWDCTKTTVSSDLLESVLATPKEEKDVLDDVMEELPMKTNTRIEPLTDVGEGRCIDDGQDDEGCDENENAKNISVVSSNWDPLHVSMNQEIDVVGVGVGERLGEEESDRDRECGEVGEESPVNGLDVCSNFKLSPSEKSNNSCQSFTSTSSTFGEIPTVAEVTNFMSQLKQLREENSPALKKITCVAKSVEQMPVESEKADELNEDNVECAMPLLEYKEWLRQHQLDTNRKNSVIHEQLKAIRCKVYGEVDFGGNSGDAEAAAEGNCNEDEGSRFPGESKMQMAGEGTSVKSISPANSFVKENTSIGEHAKDPAIIFDRTPEKITAQESTCFPTDEKRIMSLPSDTTSPAGQQQQCFPTDEKRMGLPSETTSVDWQQKQQLECRRDTLQLSPLVPAAHWSGGLARWGPSNDANTLPSPFLHQPETEKKLKIAINEDDFSFKPPSLASATGKQIAISPIVTGTVAAAFGKSAPTRFDFTISPDDNHSKINTPSSSHSPMGSLSAKSASSDLGTNAATQSKPTYSPSSKISLSPVTSKQRSSMPVRANGKSSSVPLDEASAAVSGSDGLLSCSIPEDGASYAQMLTPPDDLQMIASPVSKSPNGADSSQQFPKASSEVSSGPNASSSASPDMSEGDKGGGFSYNYPPLRSDVTTTSSKFVELGQQNTGEEEEEEEEEEELNVASTSPSLLGVTVVGSKSKRKKCKQSEARLFLLAQTMEEQDSLCSTHESESQSSNQEALVDNDDSNVGEAKANSCVRKPLDPDGYDWKELDSKQLGAKASSAIGQLGVIPENEDPDILAGGAKKSMMKSPAPSNSLDIFPETDDEGRIAAEGRVKTCFTPRATDNSNYLPTKNELDVTNDTIYLTPQSSFQSKMAYSGKRKQGGSVSSGIRELQSTFMSSESASSVSSKDYIKRSAPPHESSRYKLYDGIESTSLQYRSENRTEAKRGPELNIFSIGAASLVVAEKEVPSPPPDSKSIVEILNVTSEDDMNGSKSSETKSIKELRSIFEPLQKESQNIREGLRNQFTGSTVIGRGVYVKNRDLQTMSSLGSETYDTLESSMGKITANGSTVGEGSIGDGTLNTKKIIRYAKHLEQRGHLESEEQDSLKSFENMIEKKDTSNSSKENQTTKGAGNITNDDVDVPHTSSLEALKNVCESKSNIRSVDTVAPKQLVMNESAHLIKQMPERKNSTYDGWLLRRKASSSSAKNVAPSSGDDVASAAPMHAESPATSVKDRIAVFSGKKSAPVRVHSQSPIKVPRQQHASPNKVMVPLKQQSSLDMNRGPKQGASFYHQPQMPTGQSKTPPRMINTSHTTATPSPMPVVVNQSNWSNKPAYGIHSSPYLHSGYGNSRPSYNAPMPARFPTPNRPAHIVTHNESTNTSNYDIDDDDGITLSPTFSEVSGLTLPTCLGTVKCDSSTQSTLFDNLSRNGTLFHETMSPIARHRKQQERIKSSSGSAQLSTHPYVQRLNASVSHSTIEKKPSNNIDSADRLHEIKTPRARGSPNISQEHAAVSRREQIVSRVRASPRYRKSSRDPVSGSQECNNARQQWQEQNVIAENSNSQSSSVGNSTIFHFDGRGKGPEKAWGMERANRKSVKDTKSANHQQEQHESGFRPSGVDRRGNKGGRFQNDEQGNSLATTECIRIA